MKLNKDQRRMVYDVGLVLKRQHPDWSNHSCIEEAFIKCAGFANYDCPLETMLPEYAKNPKGNIKDYLKVV